MCSCYWDDFTFSGTFAVVSLMTGSVVEQLVPTPLEMNSSSNEAANFEAQRIGVASAVALLSGIIMVRQKRKVSVYKCHKIKYVLQVKADLYLEH